MANNALQINELMVRIDNEIWLSRKETAVILRTTVKTLSVWKSLGRHATLHMGYSIFNPGHSYYKLTSIEKHFKEWDPVRYENYIRNDKQTLGYMD